MSASSLMTMGHALVCQFSAIFCHSLVDDMSIRQEEEEEDSAAVGYFWSNWGINGEEKGSDQNILHGDKD